MTESEAINFFKDFIETLKINGEEQVLKNDYCKAANIAINALEKQEKIKEAFEKWKNDTSGIYGADDETTHLIGTLKKILRSDEE